VEAVDLVEAVGQVHTGLPVSPTVEVREALVAHWELVPYAQSVGVTALLASEAEVVASRGHRAGETERCPRVSERGLEGGEEQAVVLRSVADLTAGSLAAVLSRGALSRRCPLI
jgi:hypothetical protein